MKRLGYGEMPLQSLMQELHERCAGRIVKLDEPPHNGELSGQWKGLLRAKPSKEQIAIDKAGNKRQLYWECSIKT
ncbi:MAG TPA: hypothetical protein VL096_15140 [Pirellulaceae bacterium]|nr:hypothetical protein [Pirellulaceae bacterium]